MTNAQYNKLYKSARNTYSRFLLRTEKKLRRLYIDAAEEVAKVVQDAVKRSLSSLTVDSLAQLEASLIEQSEIIARSIEKGIPSLISDAYLNGAASIDKRYMKDAIIKAGAGDYITVKGLENTVTGINTALIRSTVNRIYQDGYTYVQRIWETFDANGLPIGVRGDFQYRIKQIVSGGLSQNRSTAEIAKDITTYANKGKPGLVKRWGRLERGTSAYLRRITKNIDWRALRIARSELYASLQQAGLFQGDINPANRGQYNWELTPGVQHECICESYAASNPYPRNDVPDYPHPNCYCVVTPVLMPLNEFTNDLSKWANGNHVPYIQEWYTQFYEPFQ